MRILVTDTTALQVHRVDGYITVSLEGTTRCEACAEHELRACIAGVLISSDLTALQIDAVTTQVLDALREPAAV